MLGALSAQLGHDPFHVLVLIAPSHDLPTSVVRMPIETCGSKGGSKAFGIDSAFEGHFDGGDRLASNCHARCPPNPQIIARSMPAQSCWCDPELFAIPTLVKQPFG